MYSVGLPPTSQKKPTTTRPASCISSGLDNVFECGRGVSSALPSRIMLLQSNVVITVHPPLCPRLPNSVKCNLAEYYVD